VSSHLDELATRIATLDPAEQDALWEKVAELNFQRGLEALAQKYRAPSSRRHVRPDSRYRHGRAAKAP
jgi:hypothetical protein